MVKYGLRQEGVLRTTGTVHIVMNRVIKETKSQIKPLNIGYVNLQPIMVMM